MIGPRGPAEPVLDPAALVPRVGDTVPDATRAVRLGASYLESAPPCIWISGPGGTPLEPVGRAVQRLLLARDIPSELACAVARQPPPAPAVAAAGGDVIDGLIDTAVATAQRRRAIVVAGPRLDAEAAHGARQRLRGLVRVSLHPLVAERGPPAIPTIYWYVQGPRILEATIPARLEEAEERPDIVVEGALRSPDELAGEIVDALVRTGWLTVPQANGAALGAIVYDSAAPGPILAVRASR